MKNILTAPFMVDAIKILSNMYRMGWDERNGGNLSYIVRPEELEDYVDTTCVKREIDLNFDASYLSGTYFLVTGTGKYFKNVEGDPANNLGLVRISANGQKAELIWGFEDGGRFTSEFPAHLMSHTTRLKIDNAHRVVLHTHPTYTIALTLMEEASERTITRILWQTATECAVVFPEGVGVLPWAVCGTTEIGEDTAAKMAKYRAVIWTLHGIFGTGRDLDEAFGLVETIEKTAQIYAIAKPCGIKNIIKDDELLALAASFKLTLNKEFID